jgi:hypothetical protein
MSSRNCKGKLIGQKAPFKPKVAWAIRARMESRANMSTDRSM